MGKAIWESYIETQLGAGFQFGMLFRTPWKRIILICCMWMTSSWLEKQNIDPMWKVLNKEVDLGEPTSFFDHVYLGYNQRPCEISKDIVDNYRTMFESWISAGATEKLPCSENLRISSWSCDMEGHAKKCVERYCELANKTTQQLYKVSTPCIDDHHFKEEELKSVGELSKVCSQIVLKCLYLARIGRPDILWSVDKTCTIDHKMDQGLWQTIISLDLLHPSHMWLQTILSCGKHCQTIQIGTVSRLRLCRRSRGLIIKIRWNTVHFFGSHTFVPISWMCKKQTSVSHCSTESEIKSLDAGLRLDGIPALDLWDLFVAVLHGNTYQSNQERRDPCTNVVRAAPHKLTMRKKFHGMIYDLDNVGFISSNEHSSRQEALLHIFEDNEAVIKMITKGRSRTIRLVSRTHRVALDWLFDGLSWDPKIQIKFVDTINQLVDILTVGNFTRDEWNHLLCLFNISHFRSTNCLEVMSKRTQEGAGEERLTSKSKPMMNLVSRYSARDPNVLASTAPKNPGQTRSESRIPLSSWTEQPPRTVKLVMGASSSDYSEWNIDEKVVFSRVEIWWNVGSKNGGDPWVDNSSPKTQTSLSSITMIWTLTRPQNRTFR